MRVLSGIQPTGNLHLGNYLGAIRNWVRMQDEMDAASQCFFFLADMHSITVHEGREQRIRNVRDMAAALVAAGIDPDRSVLFNQARVPAHAELCWLLNGTARIGWLNRMTQFKDKVGKDREGASIGLFVYPVLQAADILAYNATHVPVGEDQKQHLELARDIATKFNTDFGVELFTLPDPIIPKESARIMSLRDGTAKMSKSDPSDMSRINLTDDDDAIMQKVKKAKTDPEPWANCSSKHCDRSGHASWNCARMTRRSTPSWRKARPRRGQRRNRHSRQPMMRWVSCAELNTCLLRQRAVARLIQAFK